MYIAMNRFSVMKGEEQTFLDIWKNRDSHLDDVPGYKEFHMLQGETDEQCTTFISHTLWQSHEHFVNWTKSEAFRKAHANAGERRNIYLGPPKFEGYQVAI